MRSTKVVHIVSCHAEGEVGNVIVGGVTPPPGDTIWEQSRWIAEDQTLRITVAANEQLGFERPEQEEWNHISFCQFMMPLTREHGILSGRNTVAIDPAKLDRSPCGTGCSARMAVLYARGEIQVVDSFVGHSIIDSRFDCTLVSSAKVGDTPAIVPAIRGRAWITGTHQVMCEPEDPWPLGYRLTDTWPPKLT